jgi:hypothetical protein
VTQGWCGKSRKLFGHRYGYRKDLFCATTHWGDYSSGGAMGQWDRIEWDREVKGVWYTREGDKGIITGTDGVNYCLSRGMPIRDNLG